MTDFDHHPGTHKAGGSLAVSPEGRAAETAATKEEHRSAAGYHASREKELRQKGRKRAADAHLRASEMQMEASAAGGEKGDRALSVKARIASDQAHLEESEWGKPGRRFADFNNQWFEIFRTGDYGDKGMYTAADLEKMVANFPAWKPPLVLGHPQTDSPAMGWVAELKAEGGKLFARTEKVQPELEALVASGRFPNRSIAIYTDPKGAGPVVRHIGFLGATPPEVKGLKSVQFGDAEYIEFAVNEKGETMDKEKEGQLTHEEVGVLKQFAERVKAFFGGEPRKESFSEADVQKRVSDSVTAAETKFTAAMEKLRTEFAEKHKSVETKQAELNAGEAKGKVTAFIEKLTAAGKWVPAFSKAYGLDRVLQRLAGVPDVKLTFTEKKDGKDVEVESTDYDALCRFFTELPQIVPIVDITGAARQEGVRQFAEAGVNAREAEPINIDRAMRVKALQRESAKAGKKLTYAEAREIVVHEELAQRGSAQA